MNETRLNSTVNRQMTTTILIPRIFRWQKDVDRYITLKYVSRVPSSVIASESVKSASSSVVLAEDACVDVAVVSLVVCVTVVVSGVADVFLVVVCTGGAVVPAVLVVVTVVAVVDSETVVVEGDLEVVVVESVVVIFGAVVVIDPLVDWPESVTGEVAVDCEVVAVVVVSVIEVVSGDDWEVCSKDTVKAESDVLPDWPTDVENCETVFELAAGGEVEKYVEPPLWELVICDELNVVRNEADESLVASELVDDTEVIDWDTDVAAWLECDVKDEVDCDGCDTVVTDAVAPDALETVDNCVWVDCILAEDSIWVVDWEISVETDCEDPVAGDSDVKLVPVETDVGLGPLDVETVLVATELCSEDCVIGDVTDVPGDDAEPSEVGNVDWEELETSPCVVDVPVCKSLWPDLNFKLVLKNEEWHWYICRQVS